MDQQFLEHLIKRHTEPLERRLRNLEAKLSERPQWFESDGEATQCLEQSEPSRFGAVEHTEFSQLSLVTSESDDEETLCERIFGSLCERIFGKMRGSKSTLVLSHSGEYQNPRQDLKPRKEKRLAEADLIDADVYGIMLVSVIDSAMEGTVANFLQLTLSVFLLLTAVGLQVLVLYETAHLVTPHPVADIRDVYDQYEIIMYGNNTDRMEVTPNGKHRGMPEYFQPELFNTLSPKLQSEACHIPFSQPVFFGTICFIWSATCISEIKHTTHRFRSLICNTKTSRSMTTVFRGAYAPNERIIQELTIFTKVVIVIFLLLPRLLVTSFSLWLGSRWLAATDSFAGLIWNVVALEFVFSIKVLIYEAMSPLRANLVVQHFKMMPVDHRVEDGCHQLYGTIVWAGAAVVWVYGYMHYFQRVLPDYRWDVHDVCADWIKRNIMA